MIVVLQSAHVAKARPGSDPAAAAAAAAAAKPAASTATSVPALPPGVLLVRVCRLRRQQGLEAARTRTAQGSACASAVPFTAAEPQR